MLATLIKFPDGEICSDEELDYYTFVGETANRIYHRINWLKRRDPSTTTRKVILDLLEAGSKRKEANQ